MTPLHETSGLDIRRAITDKPFTPSTPSFQYLVSSIQYPACQHSLQDVKFPTKSESHSFLTS